MVSVSRLARLCRLVALAMTMTIVLTMTPAAHGHAGPQSDCKGPSATTAHAHLPAPEAARDMHDPADHLCCAAHCCALVGAPEPLRAAARAAGPETAPPARPSGRTPTPGAPPPKRV